ncbi:MAG: tetratricopeptide repeat protein [Silvanigrellaceae bacterium]
MKTEWDNRILVVCDIGETADALLRGVDSLLGSAEGLAPELLKEAPLKVVASADVAKLKYRFQNGKCPVGILLVSENKDSTVEQTKGLTNDSSNSRSLEGLICELDGTFSKSIFQRTLVMTNRLDHSSLRFLGEFGIKTAQLVNDLRSPAEPECRKLFGKLLSVIGSCSFAEYQNLWLDDEKLAFKLENWQTLAENEKSVLEKSLRGTLGSELFGKFKDLRESLRDDSKNTFLKAVLELLGGRPDHFNAQCLLAAVRIRQGDCGDAVQTLLRLNTLSPRNPLRHTQLGRCYIQLNRMELAEHAFVDALSLDRHQKEARMELCRMKLASRDLQAVDQLIRKTDDPILLAKFYNSMGIVSVREGRMGEAVGYYLMAHDAVLNSEEQFKILVNMGIAYAKWGKFAEANYYAGIAAALNPSSQTLARLKSILELREENIFRQDSTYEI